MTALSRLGGGTVRRYADVVGVFILVGFLVPVVFPAGDVYVWTTALIYALLAMGTNILVGWSGLLSFGQAAYFGIGAYSVALMADWELSPLLALALGGLIAGATGVVFAIVAVRTTGVEFAILTLVFAQCLFLLTFRVGVLGGDNGIRGVQRGEVLGLDLSSDRAYWILTVAVVGLAGLAIRYLRLSPLGVTLLAVRDEPVRAAALGIPVRRARVTSFGLAALFGGIAGALAVQQQGVATPNMLAWLLSGHAILMVLVGGIGTFWGPVIGAVVFTWATQLLLDNTDDPMLYLGLVFLVVVLAVPNGLVGTRSAVRQWHRGARGHRAPGDVADDDGRHAIDGSVGDADAETPITARRP